MSSQAVLPATEELFSALSLLADLVKPRFALRFAVRIRAAELWARCWISSPNSRWAVLVQQAGVVVGAVPVELWVVLSSIAVHLVPHQPWRSHAPKNWPGLCVTAVFLVLSMRCPRLCAQCLCFQYLFVFSRVSIQTGQGGHDRNLLWDSTSASLAGGVTLEFVEGGGWVGMERLVSLTRFLPSATLYTQPDSSSGATLFESPNKPGVSLGCSTPGTWVVLQLQQSAENKAF